MRRALFIACLACGIGCADPDAVRTVGRTPPRPVGLVDAIELRVVPAAINWDDDPAPDGLETQVYLYRRDQPLPVAGQGTLECLLFDRKVSRTQVAKEKPFQVWSFTAEQLAAFSHRGMQGWGYAMRLNWGERIPRSESVTLAVRYSAPGGGTVYSSPVSIPMKP